MGHCCAPIRHLSPGLLEDQRHSQGSWPCYQVSSCTPPSPKGYNNYISYTITHTVNINIYMIINAFVYISGIQIQFIYRLYPYLKMNRESRIRKNKIYELIFKPLTIRSISIITYLSFEWTRRVRKRRVCRQYMSSETFHYKERYRRRQRCPRQADLVLGDAVCVKVLYICK